ncbi:TPA: LOW QUALITY PROTEIN: hypothetical protein N0F65_011758 [Lagenidium giganteum]|uniref:Uncharacterized protein n=1 Tax=Lagenidium giganteum TaxID=4803 RepID=A0AAV2YR67_9STRA|nr:TPA: LOW QUALITY PROTEIN: hypothetical protein N0F65_011758 [Lagenidium giganteum]
MEMTTSMMVTTSDSASTVEALHMSTHAEFGDFELFEEENPTGPLPPTADMTPVATREDDDPLLEALLGDVDNAELARCVAGSGSNPRAMTPTESIGYTDSASADSSDNECDAEDATEIDDEQALASSQMDNSLLQQLVSMHQFSIENMRAMLKFAPVNDVRIALMSPLESYIHLGSDFLDRRNTILRIRDEKIDTVRRYLTLQSHGLDKEISHRIHDSFERFGKVYRLDYLQMKLDDISVQDALNALHDSHGAICDIIRSMDALTVREVFDSSTNKYKHERMVSSLALPQESPVVESNMLILFGDSEENGATVTTVDYIDQDDLYPYDTSGRIRMDRTPHVDVNGKPCVVMSNFVLAKYHLHQARLSSDAKGGEEDEPESHDDVDDKEVELLEKELIYLTAQTEFLTAKRRVVASSEVQQKPHQSKRAATSKDRARNLESELDHNLLQQLVSLHQFSIDNMRAMLSFAPVNDVRIALMTPLESYIHLGSDFVDRRNTILQMHDEKVDTVRRYLNVQSYRFKDSFERFGKTYRLEFFQMKFDNVTVQEVLHALHMVHQAVDGINRSMNALTIREVFDSDAKKYKHQRMVSNLQLSKESPVVEANMLIFLDTNQDGSAVITGDYIDRDDLYPYDSSNRIRMDHTCGWSTLYYEKDHSGADPHIDSNGVPCVVLKNFVLTKYHMHQARMSSDAKDLLDDESLMLGLLDGFDDSALTFDSDVALSSDDATGDSAFQANRGSLVLCDEEENVTAEDELAESTNDEDDEVELLEKEIQYLTAQTEFLRSRAKRKSIRCSSQRQKSGRYRGAGEPALQLTARTVDNSVLQQLVMQQQFSIDSMRAMLSFAPVSDVVGVCVLELLELSCMRIALMTPLESYIHLSSDFEERRSTILRMRDEKLAATYRYLNEQSRGLDRDVPTRLEDSFERFGKLYLLDFVQMKFDNVTVREVVEALRVSHNQSIDDVFKSVGCLTVREVYDTDTKNFKHQRVVSSLHLEKETPVIEANMLFYFGDQSPDGPAIICSDYIDKDDLYPYDENRRLRMDSTYGWMFEPLVNDDGTQSVVMKRFVLSKYHMHQSRISPATRDVLLLKMEAINQGRMAAFIKKVNQKPIAASNEPIKLWQPSTREEE